jgi:LPXTG-site transpeptidase (sortase) family protein
MKTTVKAIVVTSILFAILIGALGSPSEAYAAGPGTGWTYQRTITLSAPTPSANFQIRVQITDHSNMNADGSDLRFYDSSDIQADYWIENWNPSGTSTIWVEVPTAGTSSLTMYYGNAGATAVSDGDNTFIAFDDFSGTSIDTSKWNVRDISNATITVAAGSVTLNSGTTNGAGAQLISTTSFTMGQGVIIETVLSSSVPFLSGTRASMSGASSLSGSGSFFTVDEPQNAQFAVWSNGRDNVYGIHVIHDPDGLNNGNTQYFQIFNNGGGIGSPGTWPAAGYLLGTAFETGRVEYFLNNASQRVSTTGVPTATMYPVLSAMDLGIRGSATAAFGVDTFRVRKFSSTYNPTVTVSAESAYDSTLPTTVTVNSNTDTGDGILSEGETATVGITQLLVTFSEDMDDTTAGDEVTNVDNYLLLSEGSVAGFQTTSCTMAKTGAGIDPGDTQITINSVTYNNTTYTATLNLASALPNGIYRLYACGTATLRDLAGNALAGDGTNAGTDFTRNFQVQLAAGGGGSGTAGGTGGGEGGAGRRGASPVQIPTTGFAPGRITDLSGLPVTRYHAANGVSLEIPVLKLELPIVGVPMANRTWDVNWLLQQAGWLEGTAFPGRSGNSVLTSHVTLSYGQPGPFANLHKLELGDLVFVHRYGELLIYQVKSIKKVRDTDPSVLQHEEKSWLTLVTCADYDEQAGAYSKRLVVKAVLLQTQPDPWWASEQ